MTERFLKNDIPTKAEIEAARTWMRDQMAPYFAELHSHGFTGARMVAVAGTATTAVSICEAMETYDSSRVHKARVTRGQLAGIASRLGSQPLATRRQTVGLDPDRAPVIVAGFLILQTIMDLLGVSEFTVSESDILQGIVLRVANE